MKINQPFLKKGLFFSLKMVHNILTETRPGAPPRKAPKMNTIAAVNTASAATLAAAEEAAIDAAVLKSTILIENRWSWDYSKKDRGMIRANGGVVIARRLTKEDAKSLVIRHNAALRATLLLL